MSGHAVPITLTTEQENILKKIASRRTANHSHIQRAQIILYAASGEANKDIAAKLSLSRVTVRLWRKRWAENSEKLQCVEEKEENPKKYEQFILTLLTDQPRSGAPCTFTPEQICQLVALSCEAPEDSDYPVSHWSLSLLADEAKKRGIVPSISTRQLGRFLKSVGPKAPQS